MTEAQERLCHVYKLTNRINGKAYIGVSINPKKRFYGHKCSKYPIGVAIRKHGSEAFDLTVLLTGTEAYCYDMEPTLITAFNTSLEHGHGYNLARGGERPPSRKGKTMPPEAVERIRAASIGRIIPRASVEQGLAKRKGKPTAARGRPQSPEHIAKRTEAAVASKRAQTNSGYWEEHDHPLSKFMTYNNITLSFKQWSIKVGRTRGYIHYRLTKLGWTLGQALGFEPPPPVKPKPPRVFSVEARARMSASAKARYSKPDAKITTKTQRPE